MIYEWCKGHSIFSEATRAWKFKAETEVADKLHQRLVGAEWTKTKRQDQGWRFGWLDHAIPLQIDHHQIIVHQ
ncbi:hypothetical protein Dfri01_55810 [Dyadobacter frigoris]|nr:hypothetical protein Dfri01_55810 [Dyadobacter frigoris]